MSNTIAENLRRLKVATTAIGNAITAKIINNFLLFINVLRKSLLSFIQFPPVEYRFNLFYSKGAEI